MSITIQVMPDGVWLHFDSKSDNHAVLNLYHLADKFYDSVTAKAIRESVMNVG